jgi:hypothetical protein
MATPVKALQKRILGVRSSIKGSITILKLNSATTEVTGLQKRVINVIKKQILNGK